MAIAIESPSNIYQFGVILLLIFAVCESIFINIRLFKLVSNGHEFNLKSQLSMSKKTDIILAEMRALTQTDRISIIKFHNGSEFLPNNPIWKITSDNQAKADGVSYEHVEAVLVSRIQNIIEPIITGEIDQNEGSSIPAHCFHCPTQKLCKGSNMRVVKFNVNEMTGYSKMFFQKRGTHTAFISTINNGDNKIYGLLLVEYIDEMNNPQEEEKLLPMICSFTEKLRFLFA